MESNISRVAVSQSKLKKEAQETTKILKGKIVAKIWRHQPQEIAIEFTDGTRLFVDSNSEGLIMSSLFCKNLQR